MINFTKSDYRLESDILGEIRVISSKYWGAQTQRSLDNFKIGEEKMPLPFIKALALIKKVAALVNMEISNLDRTKGEAICKAADEIINGQHLDNFQLPVWQTGSGTQTNMNMNEVISNRAIEILGGQMGTKKPVHPNDHVNMSQSSNDTFSTAMHVSAIFEIQKYLFPALENLYQILHEKAREFHNIVKIGRTHFQDATPLTLGHEFSSYAQQIEYGIERVRGAVPRMLLLAQGGTAVGTGFTAPKGFAERFASILAEITGYRFRSAPNKLEAIASHDAIVEMSGTMNVLAASLMKIANDIKFLASGPMCGIGELILPVNEPGSSIMPGKVNPTQCEAITMVCAHVIGNNTTITIAGASGNLELNVFKPVIIYNLLQSIRLLYDSINSFADNCIAGIIANKNRISDNLKKSLMLVTALNRYIGYDNAAKIVMNAYSKNITLKDSAVLLGLITAEQFDTIVIPEEMAEPS